MSINVNRRHCLKVMGGTVASIYALGMLGGCEEIAKQIKNRPIRRSITTLANNDPIVTAYRDAVTKMKALPSTDRRNWTRQAEIHNNFCPHGNWYFLPWHRAYLFYFESIVRELSGYAAFALPYWNWTCSPRIPAHFFGSGNPLLDTTRTKGPSDTIPASMTGESVLATILAIPDFETFGSFQSNALRGGSGGGYGELEGTPHNSVHGWIGGDMGAFMSPLDPVFWCHHNMIERCWWDWNITQHKNNPNSPDWNNMSLANMFCDKDGTLVTNLTVGFTALYPVLSYQFDDQLLPCSGIFKVAPGNKNTEELKKFLQTGGAHHLRVQDRITAPIDKAVLVQGRTPNSIKLPVNTLPLLQKKSRPEQRVALKINQARLLGESDIFVRVFINPPADTDFSTAESDYYAGSFAFFGDGSHDHSNHSGNTYHIDITDAVEKLLRKGLISDRSELKIILAAVSINDGKSVPKGQVEVAGLEVILNDGFE